MSRSGGAQAGPLPQRSQKDPCCSSSDSSCTSPSCSHSERTEAVPRSGAWHARTSSFLLSAGMPSQRAALTAMLVLAAALTTQLAHAAVPQYYCDTQPNGCTFCDESTSCGQVRHATAGRPLCRGQAGMPPRDLDARKLMHALCWRACLAHIWPCSAWLAWSTERPVAIGDRFHSWSAASAFTRAVHGL